MPAVAEKKVTNGAVLVHKLAKTGTGESKLAPCRKKLADVHRSEMGRVASAEEILDVLRGDPLPDGTLQIEPAPEGTMLKAKTIIATGEWVGPPHEVAVPIEVKLLGDEAVAEWEAEQKAEHDKILAAAKPEKAKAKEPVGDEQPKPGVHASPVMKANAPGVHTTEVDPAFAAPKAGKK